MPPQHDHPPRPTNPYPPPGTEVARLRYRSALVLVRFKDAVQARQGSDADYVLGRNFEVDWWARGEADCRRLVVPAGMITDLTSVPLWGRWFVGRVGPWLEAAILHDYLYVAWQDIPGRGPREADRRFADDLMLAAMREADVPRIRARIIHAAVRLGGRGPYRSWQGGRYVDLTDPEFARQIAFALPPETCLSPAPRRSPSRPRDGSAPSAAGPASRP